MLQEVIAHTDVRKVLVTAVGDMLGAPKSWIVNYVVRHKRKQVTPWHIDGAVDFRDALAAGRQLAARARDVAARGHRVSSVHRRHDGRVEGRDAHAREHRRERRAGARLDRPDVPERAARSLITPLPLYHIFALTANCLLFMLLGWKNMLITNPRDFPAFVAELKKYRLRSSPA